MRAVGIIIAALLPLSSGPVTLNAATLLWDSDANATNGVTEANGTFTWVPGTTSTFLNGGTLTSTTNDLTTDIAQFGNGGYLQGLATINVNTGSINGVIFGADLASFGSNYLLTNTGASTLTIGANGIVVNSGAAANTVGSTNLSLALGAAQSWVNNSTKLLTIGGAVANGGNLLTLAPGANGGGITASGVISGLGGLTVNGASAGVVTLSNAANTFSGPVTLTSGVLSIATLANIGSNSGIGTGDATSSATNAASLVLDGGTLRYTGGTVSTTRLFTLTQNGGTIDQSPATAANTLTFGNTGNIAFSGTGARTLTLTGSGTGANVLNPVLNNNGGDVSSLTKTGVGAWTLGNAIYGYTGTTTVSAGTLTVSGTAGSIVNSTQITLNGGKLVLDYTAGNTDRIGAFPVSLSNGGEFSITANTGANTSEGVGAINITGGNSTVTVGSAASRVTTLTGASFARSNNATALIRGTSLNQSAASNVSQIKLTSTTGLDFVGNVTLNNGVVADATKGLRIIPYFIGDTAVANTGSNFVTYDTTLGLRVLLGTEMDTMTAGTTTAANPINALAGANITLTAAVSTVAVNSLSYNTATTATTLNGTTANNTALQVNSGAVANFNTGTFTIGAVGTGFTKLLLGDGTWNEGILTATQAALTINSPVDVTGGGGLTKAGANTVTLAATALYTGATNINQGTLQFAATTGDIASSSGISLNGGTLNINRTNGMTIAQNIIGTATTGGLIQNAAGGTTILSGTNTYSAPTTITAGTLQFKGSSALPSSTAISLGAGTLQVLQDGAGNNGTITVGNNIQITASGGTINVGNNGSGNTGNTVAFGSLLAPNSPSITVNFTGSNSYNQSFSSVALIQGTGSAFTLNPTSTNVTIAGNVTNAMSGFSSSNFDTLGLDGTTTGNAITGGIFDAPTGAFTPTNVGGYTKLLKSNTGTWTLSGTGSTYTGTTTIAGGTLKAGANNIIPLNNTQGVVTTAVGAGITATYDLNGFNQTFNNAATALTLGGTTGATNTSTSQVLGSGSTIFLTGTGGGITYSNTGTPLGGLISVSNLDLGNAQRTFTVGDSSSTANELIISSAITNGTINTTGVGNVLLSGSITAPSSPGTLFTTTGTTTGALSVSGTVTSAVNQSFANASTSGGTLTLAGKLDMGSSNTLTISGAGTTRITNTATGAGANVLTGGVTVNGSTLVIYAPASGGVNAGGAGSAASGTVTLSGTNPVLRLAPSLGTSLTNGMSAGLFAKGYTGSSTLAGNNFLGNSVAISGMAGNFSYLNVAAGGGTISNVPIFAAAAYPINTSFQINGLIQITTAGNYVFGTATDDFGSLQIDGNSPIVSAVSTVNGSLYLTAGLHIINYRAGNASSNGNIGLQYQGPDQATLGTIPAGVFFSANNTSDLATTFAGATLVAGTSATIDVAVNTSMGTVAMSGTGTGTTLLTTGSGNINTLTISGVTMTDSLTIGQTAVNSTAITSIGTIDNTSSSAATLTLNAAANQIGTVANSVTGNITQSGGGALTVTKAGSGTWILNGTNSYSGGTNLNGGLLSVSSDSALGVSSGPVTFNGGGLQVTGTSFNTWSSSRALTLTGAATFDIANQANNYTIGQSLTAGGAFTKLGQGTLTITNNLNMGANALTANAGTLTLPNGLTSSATANTVGGVAGTSALVNFSGGTTTITGADGDSIFKVGVNGGFGAVVISGGASVTAPRIQLGDITGTNNVGTLAVLSGSTLKLNNYFIGGRTSPTNTGVATIAGGTLDLTTLNNSTGTYGGGRFEMNFGTNLGGGNSGGVINDSGKTFQIVQNTTTSQGIVNLATGATLHTNSVSATGAATGSGIVGFNFHGGTLLATAAGTLITSNVSGPTSASGVSIWSEGATISNNGFNVTIASALQAPTGNGVASISVSGGTGYFTAPYVKIVGGNNDATAVATIDNRGNITGIVITNPGTGYTSAPTVTLVGGTNGTAATGTATLNSGNTGGTLTLTGSGVTTFGAINTVPINVTDGGAIALSAGGAVLSSSIGISSGVIGRNIITPATSGVILDTAAGLQDINRVYNGTGVGAIAVTSATAGTNIDLTNSPTGLNLPSMGLAAGPGAVNYTGTFTPGSSVYRLGGITGGTLTFNQNITDAASTNRSSVAIQAAGTIILGGTNTFSGGFTLPTGGTLQIASTNVAANFGANPAGLTSNGGTIQWGTGSTVDISPGGTGAIAGGITLATTTSFDTNGNNVILGGSIGNNGAGGLTKTGTGTLTLSGANTFTGTTTVSAGTLILNNTDALYKSNLASITNTGGAPNVQFSSSVASKVFTLGGLTGSVNMALQDNAGSPAAITLRIGNNNGASAYTGVLSGAGSIVKLGSGALTFSANQTYTGSTTITQGNNTSAGNGASSITLTFGTSGGTLTNILPSATALKFGGTAPPQASPTAADIIAASPGSGTLTLTGAAATNSQTVASTAIGLGGAGIVLTSSTTNPLLLNLGAITRTGGGTLNITQPSNALSATNGVTTTSGSAGTILTDANGTAYATIGNNDWAAKDTVLSASNIITSAATAGAANATLYTASIAGTIAPGTAANVDFQVTNTTAWTTQTVNSLRLNATAAQTLSIAASNTLTVATGGILIGTGAAAAQTISGGTIISGTGKELVVINNGGAANVLTSVIADSASGASDLTIRSNPNLGNGKGDIRLGTQNTYSGNTYIIGGRVAQNNATGTTPFGTGNVYIFGNTNGQFYQNQTNAIANHFYIEGNGWAETSGPFGAIRLDSGTISGAITLMGDATVAATATGTGSISGPIDGAFNLTKGNGAFLIKLSGNNTSFTGATNITAGAFQYDNANAIGGTGGITIAAAASAIGNYAGGGTALLSKVLTGSTGTVALTSLSANDTMDFSATNAAGVYLGAGSGSTITYGGTYTPNTVNGVATYRLGGGGGTLTFGENITGNSALVIGGGNGNNATGTVILSGANTYRGGTTFNSGTGSVTLRTPNSATPFAVLGTGPLVFTANGIIQLNSSTVVGNADLSSASNLTSISLNGGTAQFDTNGVGALATPVVFAQSIGNYGAGVFQKNGTGFLRLDSVNTNLGNTQNTAGTLLINNANPFNAGFSVSGAASNAAQGPTGNTANTMQLLVNTTIATLVGTNTTSTSATAGILNLNSKNLTLAGSTGATYTGTITNSTGTTLTKAGGATQTLGSNTGFAGTTNVAGGVLSLDYSVLTTTPTAIIATTSPLILSGGTLSMKNKGSGGTNAQTFAGLTINTGGSAFAATLNGGTSLTLNLGAITRTVAGGTVDFATGATSLGTGAVNTTTTNGATTILGGYATAGGGASFATVTTGVIGALATGSYSTTYSAGTDVDNGTLTSIGASPVSINSLRFNSATAQTVDATAGLTISSGGLLVTPTVAANATAITGGTITSGNGLDLIVHQFNTNAAGALTIGSQITGNIGLTKAGSGTLILTNAANNYTGATNIGGSGNSITTAYLQVNATGAIPSASQINLNSAGGLAILGGVSLSNNITISNATGTSGQGAIYAVGGSGTATVSGTVQVNNSVVAGGVFAAASGTTLAVTGQVNAASGQVVSVRTGNVIFSGGGTYDYFEAGGNVSIGATNGLSTNAVVDIGGPANGVLDLAGFSQTVTGLTKLGTNTATLTNSSATTATLTLNVGSAITTSAYTGNYTYSGALTGNLAVVKSGAGTETLSGANTFMGGTTLSSGTLKIGSGTALGGINGTSGALVINGGTLDLNGTSTVAVGAFSGSGGTITDSTSGTGTTVFSVASNSSASFAGAINDGVSKSLAFFKDGTGTLTLTNGSTYSGITNIFQGALNIQSATALGSTAGSTVVSTGAALEIQGGITVGVEALTLNGSGSGTAAGALRNISGTNAFGGAITLASASRINSDAGTLTLSNSISSANFLPTFGGAGNTTVTGSMSLGTVGITKDGAGTLSLQNGNTFSGTATVSNGTLNISNATALGTADGTAGAGTTVASGAVLQVQGGIAVGNEALITPILQSVSGNNSWAGNIQAANGGSITLQSDANTLTLSGTINGQSPNATNRDVILTGAGDGALSNGITNPASVIKSGAGTWTLNGANTYSSATTISAGTLKAGAANVLSSNSAYSLANTSGAVLDLNNTAQTIASLSGGGATGGNVSTGGTSGILTTGDSTSTTFGGTISGDGGLTKQGSGTFTLTNSNGYTGATTVSAGKLQVATGGAITASSGIAVNGGSLSVNGSISSGVPITVASGAKILGTGTASGAITLNNGGIIEAGELGVGKLTTGNITFGSNATDLAIVNLFNIGTGGSASIINATTLATVGGNNTITINATNSGSLSNGTYDLITHTGGALSSTDFAAFTKGVITGLSGRQSGTLTNGVTALQLLVAGDAPKWTGFDTTAGANSSSWQINPAITNWQLITATTPTDFQADDSALFDDTATGSLTVDINLADVAPTSVTIDNSTKIYTLQSTGGFGITGSTGIVKNGTALVSINNSNSFTGGIIVNAGTLALNAANTFTGGVAINYTGISGNDKGVVRLGVAGALGTTNAVSFGAGGTGRLQLNGYNATIVGLTTDAVTPGSVIVENSNATLGADSTLTVNLASGTNTYAGVLQDGGAGKLGLTKAGNGTLILTGSNSLTGGNAVTGGTLQIGSGGTSGELTGDTAISASTSLVFNRSDSTTYTGGTSGAGSLTTQGGGTTILTGNAAHTGGTSIASGSILQIGIGAATGALSGTGTITNNGTLAYNRDNTASSTIQAIIASTGALAVNSGTLILTGANTFSGSNTIASGATLQIGSGGTIGTLGTVASVTDNGTLTFNRSDAISIATNVTGSGALTMAGAGSLTLTGTNSYSGGTNVQSGTLVLGSASAIPTNTAVTVGSSGNSGTLDLNGRGLSVSSLSTAGTAANQTITNNSTTTAILTYNSAGLSTFGGNVADGAPTKKIGVTITGGGTLQLNKTNAYTGGTVVPNGTAKLGANNAFSTGAITLGGTGTVGILDLNGFNQSISSFTVGSGGVAASQVIGNSSTTANSVLSYTGNATTFAGTIQDVIGGGTQTTGLTLSGTGIFGITANNTYTGTTTIGAGTTLQLGTGGTVGNIGNGAVSVANGGALTFNRTNTYTLGSGNLVTGAGNVNLISSGSVAASVDGQFNTTGALVLGTSGGTTPVTLNLGTTDSNTFGSLSVQTNTAAANTISIGTGKTLTFTGGPTAVFTVGANTAAGTTTNLNFTGGGNLTVNRVGGTVQFGGATGATNTNNFTVDMSGLANFTANLGTTGIFAVGDNNSSTGSTTATLTGATNNTITANTFGVGYTTGESLAKVFNLGTGTNVINANTISIGETGGNRGSGTLQFAGSGGTLQIRSATGATGTANLNMENNGSGTGTQLVSQVLLAGHSVDVSLNAIVMSARSAGVNLGSDATLTFDTGTLTANSVSMVSRTGTTFTGGASTGTISIGGGTASLGAVTMTTNSVTTAVSTGNATALLNINGGGTTTLTSLSMANDTVGATTSTSNSIATLNIGTTSGAPTVTLGTVTMATNNSLSTTGNTASATINIAAGSVTATSLSMANTPTAAGSTDVATAVLNITGGTLTVNGAITTGTTGTGTRNTTLTLNGGTLNMTNNAIGAAGAGTIGSGSGALNFQSGTLSNVSQINGGAGLTKTAGSGTNTLVLDGTNGYTGNTVVSSGTLQLGNGSTTGTMATTSPISVSTGATFAVKQSDTVVQGTDFSSAPITGAGGFDQAGSGKTVFTAANGYTGSTSISNGTLQLGNGGTTGSLSTTSAISISSGATLAINRTNTVSQGTDFSGGDLAGAGGVVQIGTGKTVLNRATGNSYSGGTTVSLGTLQVGNTSGSATGTGTVTVGTAVSGTTFATTPNAATLSGTGFIGTDSNPVNVNIGTAPGTSPTNGVATTVGGLEPGVVGTVNGTLQINGNLTIDRGSMLTLKISNVTTNHDDGILGALLDGSYFTTYLASHIATYNAFKPVSGESDFINITGSLRIGDPAAGTVTIANNGYVGVSAGTEANIGDYFNLLDWAGALSGTPNGGTFATAAGVTNGGQSGDLNLPTLSAGLSWDVSQFATSGIVIVVPEPSRTVLLLIGLTALVARRRRKVA